MPIRRCHHRRYELRRDWMVYFVTVEQLGRRVASRTGSLETTYDLVREGRDHVDIFESEERARARFEEECERAAENRVLTLDRTTDHELTDDDAAVGAAEPDLERAVLERDDEASAAVYSDWLTTRSDKRGELAALFLQGRADEARRMVLENLSSLFGRFELDLKSRWSRLDWRMGFLHGLPLGWGHRHLTVAETTARVLELPVCRLVRALRLEPIDPSSCLEAVHRSPRVGQITEVVLPGAADAVTGAMALPAVRRLELTVGLTFGRSAMTKLANHPELRRLEEVRLRTTPADDEARSALEHLLENDVAALRLVPRVVVNVPVSDELRQDWPGLVVRLD